MNKNKSKLYLNLGVINLLFRIWNNLFLKRKIQLILIFFLMLISGFAEAFTLATVLPFLSILTKPDKFLEYGFVAKFTNFFGINDNKLLFFFTTFFCISVIVSGVIKLFNIRLNGLLCSAITSDISCEAYRKNLYQPYEYHTQNNTSKVITELSSYTLAMHLFLNRSLMMLTNICISAFILITLFYLSFKTALIIGTIFVGAYLTTSLLSNKVLIFNSKLIAKRAEQQVLAVQEGLGSIRDLILDNTHKKYLSRFRDIDISMRRKQADNNFISSAPKFVLESIGIIVIVLIGYSLSNQENNSFLVVPLLGSFALGAQRLLPALQQSFASWTLMKANVSSVNKVIRSLEKNICEQDLIVNRKPFKFAKEIQFKNVCYKYKTRDKLAINNISLCIKKGEKLGIIGSTGCGKTTLIDLLIGLLKPTQGEIFIDNKILYDSSNLKLISAWRKSISHVPQNIYLTDSTIAENIAFTDSMENINYSKVKKVAKLAKIDEFINTLPLGYKTIVGERGLSLSGGQRQRIGIARALYKNAQILVLDEGTSALDNKTETSVINSINNFSMNITLIIVAHRLSTVKDCDRVVRLEEGKIAEIGSPSDVL